MKCASSIFRKKSLQLSYIPIILALLAKTVFFFYTLTLLLLSYKKKQTGGCGAKTLCDHLARLMKTFKKKNSGKTKPTCV